MIKKEPVMTKRKKTLSRQVSSSRAVAMACISVVQGLEIFALKIV
jgi:hypothetical protein